MEEKRTLREERNIKISNSSTTGTAVSHAHGYPARPVSSWIVVTIGRIHTIGRASSTHNKFIFL
ncbi:MAG: hypothetical protein ACTSUE_13390 [Promethearchaeota archaeon]